MSHTRPILAIALPAIVSNITTPVLALVDVAITGHIGEAVFLAAIALGTTLFNTLYWLFNFLRMGTSGPTAQAYGAGDSAVCAAVLARSLLIAVAVGLVLIAVGWMGGGAVLRFMDADDATQALALEYFRICIFGAPAVLITYSVTGWLIGMQNTRATMAVAIATNVLNVAVSATLVFGFGMKLAGVAVGTLSAQWAGALMGLAWIVLKYRFALPPLRVLLRRKPLARFFSINTDIFLRTACLVAVTFWFTHAGAVQSVSVLAANSLLMQLFMLFSFFMDGFAYAGEALAGKYFGAGNMSHLRGLIRELVWIGAGFAVIFGTVYFFLGGSVLGLLTDETSVVATAAGYLPWAALVPLCGFAAFIWDGILVGLIRTRIMLAAMAAAMLTFFSVYALSVHHLGNHGLWLAFCCYLAVRGLAEWWLFRRNAGVILQ